MDLSDDMMDQYAVCRFDRTIIQGRKNDLGECSIDIITRIEAQMQGNYRLEIRLTLSDILTLFWIAFKDKALQAIFQNKLAPEKSEARSLYRLMTTWGSAALLAQIEQIIRPDVEPFGLESLEHESAHRHVGVVGQTGELLAQTERELPPTGQTRRAQSQTGDVNPRVVI